ncbi:glutamate-5-semialdehyde dehydrogenase [Carnimonas bestiolae]|uniref:glutamate-5-semialdehyde dehydrogenase n=1 Tax=Carnimonas bestiolae TaxID=3402172 RepID=UPI003EDCA52E
MADQQANGQQHVNAASYVSELGQAARQAAGEVAIADTRIKNLALEKIADHLDQARQRIKQANQRDLEAARERGLDSALIDRLELTDGRIDGMISGLATVASLDDPVGQLDGVKRQRNGLEIGKMRVPIGVIGIIFESRPNVTIDAAALCLKSGNVCILRAGSEARHSVAEIATCITQGLKEAGLPEAAVQVVAHTDREIVGEMVRASDFVDLIIPRGGRSLIERISNEARVPVLKHLDGICHIYVDAGADLNSAADIAFNAKTYRYGICGAMETLLVNQQVAAELVPAIAQRLTDHGVEVRGCEEVQRLYPDAVAASESDWSSEYLGPILSIKVVADVDAAIAHINHYGSHHTDSIISDHLGNVQRFTRAVDSSSVVVNAPTCFADGAEYGLGAEIGISTDKLHARGPVGLEGLTTQKYLVVGRGQLRG